MENVDFKKIFSDRLKGLIDERRLSVKEICKELEVSTYRLLKWQRGESSPSLKYALMLAGYFKVKIDYLAGFIDEKRES